MSDVKRTKKIRIFEVAPRDGIQNEYREIPFVERVSFVNDLIHAGVQDIELGAFVRPDRVPQMADTDEIYQAIGDGRIKLKGARAWSLVPNLKGLQRALHLGAKTIAVFTAATETFAQRNIGMKINESLAVFAEIIGEAKRNDVQVRGYISTAFFCPFEGKTSPKDALRVIEKLAKLGVCEVSIGDTIGAATPKDIEALIRPALKALGKKKVAGHFHDTRGTALANALRAIELGVTTLDSSAGGLGGCPFAPGAAGNLATEDLVYMLDGMGIETGINLKLLAQSSLRFMQAIERPLSSKYLQAFASAQKKARPTQAT